MEAGGSLGLSRTVNRDETMSESGPLRVLQVASCGMEFFHEQVRILREHGVKCDVLYALAVSNGGFRENGHSPNGLMEKIYGHNPLYYAIQASSFYPQILQSTFQQDYDLIHVNSGIVAPLGLIQPQRPVVLTLWGDDLLGDRLGGMQPRITKFCAKRSDHVIVRSQEMKDALPCDATIIPSGIDMNVFRPMSRDEARKAVGWDSTKHHVLFPYPRTRDKKRYPVAKQVVENVNQQLGGSVELHEVYQVDHKEMPLYYNAADVLLLPSLREGSPNTVKEAMACNVPVVSTDVGDVRERLGPVVNSYVCSADSELEDALVSVLRSDARSDGRQYVHEVSLERMGERIMSIYESVLEEPRSVPQART